jgi:hypothetical protein
MSATIWDFQMLFSSCSSCASIVAHRRCLALSRSSVSVASRPVIALFLLQGKCFKLGSANGFGNENSKVPKLAVSLSYQKYGEVTYTGQSKVTAESDCMEPRWRTSHSPLLVDRVNESVLDARRRFLEF